jgi:hypothetical protein
MGRGDKGVETEKARETERQRERERERGGWPLAHGRVGE